MSINLQNKWLDDDQLRQLAKQGIPVASITAHRYDAMCPSEFYRGYATLLFLINGAIRKVSGQKALIVLIDEFDSAIKVLPDDEQRNGASLALTNVASYARAGTVPQVAGTVAAELVCIAHCFVKNQARGL